MRRVALLGGTFDPIHRGHLAIASQVADALRAEETWLVPAGVPPHREPPQATPEERLAMARIAVEGQGRLRVLDLEVRRGGASYTIDTLTELSSAHPGTELWLVVGADAAPTVRGWHRAGDLFRWARFALVNRSGTPPFDGADVRRWGFAVSRTRVVTVDSPPVWATDVRRRAAEGKALEGLVPATVAALIADLGLYRLR